MNTVQADDNDPSKVTVVRWVMDNSHCGWLIGKGGSGIQNIEVRGLLSEGVWVRNWGGWEWEHGFGGEKEREGRAA